MDLHEIEHKTVNDLREMAKEYDDIQGASGLKKEELLDILCGKLGIDRQEHVPEGIGRRKMRAEIRTLRGKRDEALAQKDSTALAGVRGAIKAKKRRLRRQINRALLVQKGQPKPKPDSPES